jgi:hypothetical protein
MTEFITGICWQTFNCKDVRQTSVLVNSGFKMLRIFIDMANLPQGEPTQSYIANFMNTVDGLHYWTYEGKPGLFQSNAIVKDSFDFCKKEGWLPIVCLGYREEQPHNWLGRNPSGDKWLWLGKFSKAFATYLNNWGFPRADVEIWNEPSKVFGWEAYSELAYIMGSNWKSVNPNYKLHIFTDDSFRTGYLRDVMNNIDLMNITDYISIHVGVGTEQEEWDNKQISIVKNIISKIPHLKLAVTEMSPNGKWEHMQQLIDSGVSMYGLMWAIRKEEVGTAFVIDDVWQIRPDQSVLCSSPTKRDILTAFNHYYYEPYEIIEEDMKLEKLYKVGSQGIGVKFIQKVLNEEIAPDPLLLIDGQWGSQTTLAVTAYQKVNNLKPDGIVGEITFKNMIAEYPEIWNQIEYAWAIGVR